MADLYQLLCVLVSIACIDIAISFKDGAPAYSCKDPTTFHTKKLNATHEGIILPRNMKNCPYKLVVRKRTFKPGEKINVTLKTEYPNLPFKGFFIHTVEGNMKLYNLTRVPYGTFTNMTKSAKPSPCEDTEKLPAGGITHTNNGTKSSISVIWIAPKQFSKRNIVFVATAVKNYDTYWTNVRSHVLRAVGFKKPTKRRRKDWSPSAIWYLWQKFIRQLSKQKHHGGSKAGHHADQAQQGVNQGHANQGGHHGNEGHHDNKKQHAVNKGQKRGNQG